MIVSLHDGICDSTCDGTCDGSCDVICDGSCDVICDGTTIVIGIDSVVSLEEVESTIPTILPITTRTKLQITF